MHTAAHRPRHPTHPDNNNAYYVLRPVLEEVTGTAIDALSRDWLWSPLGAASSSWYQRPGAGSVALDPKGRQVWGLTMTVRDMGRLGMMVGRGGTWDRSTVVERAYLDEALRPSQPRNSAYGYLWWLNCASTCHLPGRPEPVDGPLITGAPVDLVAAQGKGDQKIYVSRSTDLVVARLGDAGGSNDELGSSDFSSLFWSKLMAAAPR